MRVIEVQNVKAEVFKMFLNHIYGKEFAMKELYDVSSMVEMFQLVGQYNMVELRIKLLARIKSQTVEKENFTAIVNLVVYCDCKVHNEASYSLEVILSRYLRGTT